MEGFINKRLSEERFTQNIGQSFRLTGDQNVSDVLETENQIPIKKIKLEENECQEREPIGIDQLWEERQLIDIDQLWEERQPIDIDQLWEERQQEDLFYQNERVFHILDSKTVNEDLNNEAIALRGDLLRRELEAKSPIETLNDYELKSLLGQLSIQSLLVASSVCPKWRNLINKIFEKQTYLWFCSNQSSQRFLPLEDCCDNCHDKNDIKLCTKVKQNSITDALDSICELTPGFQLPQLQCLRLYRFSLNEDLIETLAKICPNLLHLDMTESKQLNDAFFKKLGTHFPNLKHLILVSTEIKEEEITSIVDLRNLKTLVVSQTYITGKCLRHLSDSIERIDIRGCPQLNPNEMMSFSRTNLQKIRNLKLEALLDDVSFVKMCSTLSNLNILEVTNSTNARLLTSQGLAQITKLSNLRSLKFGHNIVKLGIPLIAIFSGCPFMKSFSLDATDSETIVNNIKENHLIQIADYWPLLERLELINLWSVRDSTIKALSRMEFLRYIDLTESVNLEDDSIQRYLPRFPKVNYLVLDKCHRLSKGTADAVIAKARQMGTNILSVSLIRCKMEYFPYLRAREVPRNLRLTFSSVSSSRYCTFNGFQTKYGKLREICNYLNGE